VLGGRACESRVNPRYAVSQNSSTQPRSNKEGDQQGYGTEEECEEEWPHICCANADFTCEDFIAKLRAPESIYGGSTALLELICKLKESFQHSFDFTRSHAVWPGVFMGKKNDEAAYLAREISVPLDIVDEPARSEPLDPLHLVQSYVLRDAGQPMQAFQSAGRIVGAAPDLREVTRLEPKERQAIEREVKRAQAEATAAKARAQQLEGRVKAAEAAANSAKAGMQRLERDINKRLANAEKQFRDLSTSDSAKVAAAFRREIHKGISPPEPTEGEEQKQTPKKRRRRGLAPKGGENG